ncbi:MAG: gamma-glutamyltransferase, partial [Rhodospirillales bacterium]
MATIVSCGDSGPKQGQIGYVEGFFGGVVADEPNSAQVGRDVLTAGGTAVDAAVATYFAMAVMLPSSASLGGGGVCLVHWSKDRKTEALTFLTKLPASGSPGTVPVGVPGNVRGMAALHARYGVLRWEQLVGAAERMSR